MKSKAATAPITFEEVVMAMIKIKKCRIIHGRERRVTCQQLIGDIRYFFTCVFPAFLSAGNP